MYFHIITCRFVLQLAHIAQLEQVMGQYTVAHGLGLLATLQLVFAVKSLTRTFREYSCNDEDLICESETSKECTCEGRKIGPGVHGKNEDDFVADARTEEGVPDPGKFKSFWDFSAYQYGKEVQLSTFKNKAVLVVNIACA